VITAVPLPTTESNTGKCALYPLFPGQRARAANSLTLYRADLNAGVCTDVTYISQHKLPVQFPPPPQQQGAVIPQSISTITFTEVSGSGANQPAAQPAKQEGA
jgi:hypothetical protein